MTCTCNELKMEVLIRLASTLVRDIDGCVQNGLTTNALDAISTQADHLLRGLAALSMINPAIHPQVTAMQGVVTSLNNVLLSLAGTEGANSILEPRISFESTRGRPRVVITKEMLEYFMERGFTATQIAALLQVSLSTVRRRMSEYGLYIRNQYSRITDAELDRFVTLVIHEHPHWGYRMVQGHLLSIGHRIQQSRARECMLRLDPEGVVSRWLTTIRRRTYSVPGPNCLWHLDGNHKLIR